MNSNNDNNIELNWLKVIGLAEHYAQALTDVDNFLRDTGKLIDIMQKTRVKGEELRNLYNQAYEEENPDGSDADCDIRYAKMVKLDGEFHKLIHEQMFPAMKKAKQPPETFDD